ncbi:probable mediator of RNA polymerase II transcription subunit 26b [Macadamia integrifolia]|uniref:probable mediator of RNA polymerase II transcription subunit 26b n=1 Tax=Macadamia integrifolia TaxID=60698 RepID=UPI001C4E633C|nr:probable mediator of RNA polymerase II transcription subunit 26b [Macadamia integrifolia]
MSSKTHSLSHWRGVFKAAGSDIFELIEYAIMVAASDRPKEFKRRRDGIAEMIFNEEMQEEKKKEIHGSASMKRKESHGNSGIESDNDDDIEPSFPEENAEQINNIIAEIYRINRGGEIKIVEEVLRIKGIIEAKVDQSERKLLEPLRRLQLISISFDTLKKTLIGVSVKNLTKHNSKRIRDHAKYLITHWTKKVDQWLIESNEAAAAKKDEQERLQALKRKIKEGYQKAENAKKQRCTKVLELKDLPKGLIAQRRMKVMKSKNLPKGPIAV